jgi:serine/threonine protein kinase/DNA-binding CsgD family transcriptional regulator
MELSPPSLVNNRYRLVEWLGQGNMGIVFRAHDEKLDRNVAIKFLPINLMLEADTGSRFMREARAVARLSHPNIMMIYDVGEDGPWRYLVLEYITGTDLHSRLEQHGVFSVPDSLSVIRSALSALSYAHGQGVIHRDIKPENIMITQDGQVKVTDFGLALPVGDVRLTRDGAMVGTVLYMAPEVVKGEPVDHRTDLYSLGVVSYEMLSGKTPVEGTNIIQLLEQIVSVAPVPLHLHNPKVPTGLEQVISKLMSKKPADRYTSAEEALLDLPQETAKPPPETALPAGEQASTSPASSLLERLVRSSSVTRINEPLPSAPDADESPLLAVASPPETPPDLAQALLVYAAYEDNAEVVEAERRRLADLLEHNVVEPVNLLISQANTYEQILGANPQARMFLSVLSTLARQVLQQARDLGANLHPVTLNSLGLEPSLELLADQYTRTHGLTIKVELQRLQERLAPIIELALFRLTQEVLDHIARRGLSNRVVIHLASLEEAVLFELWDNSASMDPIPLGASGQRIVQLGGILSTSRKPEGGLKLSISFKAEALVTLTPREMEIIQLLVEGASNKIIAQKLVISPRTVNFHLDNIYSKLGVATRLEAAVYAIRHGWVQHTLPLPV